MPIITINSVPAMFVLNSTTTSQGVTFAIPANFTATSGQWKQNITLANYITNTVEQIRVGAGGNLTIGSHSTNGTFTDTVNVGAAQLTAINAAGGTNLACTYSTSNTVSGATTTVNSLQLILTGTFHSVGVVHHSIVEDALATRIVDLSISVVRPPRYFTLNISSLSLPATGASLGITIDADYDSDWLIISWGLANYGGTSNNFNMGWRLYKTAVNNQNNNVNSLSINMIGGPPTHGGLCIGQWLIPWKAGQPGFLELYATANPPASSFIEFTIAPFSG